MNRPGNVQPGAIPRDDSSLGSALVPVSCPNQAFILAVAAWSSETGPSARTGPRPITFRKPPDSRLSPGLRQELEPLLDQLHRSADTVIEPVDALDRLKRAHRAESRPDLDRIHPTWWLRALQEEPTSVRAAVARYGPPRVRQALTLRFNPLPDESKINRTIPPEILSWVLALWQERFVGDLPERDDDPLAIAALSRLSLGSVYRIVRMTGIVKVALAGAATEELQKVRLRAVDLERITGFRRFFTPIEPTVREFARRDIQAMGSRQDGRLTSTQRLGLVGLSTFGRLLASCEPYRVRWALQHLPYPIAKRIRNQMPRKEAPAKSLVKLENLVLAAAWHRLEEEGTLVPSRNRDPIAIAGSAPP